MKTLIKLANANRHFKGFILFSGNTARATNIEAHAIIDNGPWNFVNPTVVSVSDLKMAMALAKEQKWQGDTLNGVQLTSAMPTEDFFPLPENLPKFTPIQANNLPDALVKVAPAMGKHDIRYYLNGVCFDFEEGAAMATDGHRMHLVKNAFTSELKGQAIVPRDTIALIGAKNITAIAFSDKHCRIDYAGGFVISQLIDGKFPDWQRVLPQESARPHAVAFGEKQVNACAMAVKLAKETKDKSPVVLLSVMGDIAYKSVTVDFSDDFPITYALNPIYLSDALETAQEGTIHLNEGNDSMLIRNGDFSAVVMPCKY